VRSQLHAAQAENNNLRSNALAHEASINSLRDALNKAVQRFKEEQLL
jgi:hypothetical protein